MLIRTPQNTFIPGELAIASRGKGPYGSRGNGRRSGGHREFGNREGGHKYAGRRSDDERGRHNGYGEHSSKGEDMSPKRKKSQGSCYNCGRFGHRMKDCKVKKR